jgi:hypothetical protein
MPYPIPQVTCSSLAISTVVIFNSRAPLLRFVIQSSSIRAAVPNHRQEIFDQIKILHPEFNPNFTSPEEFPALQARQYTPREPHQPIGIPECVPIGTWGWSACLSQAIFNNNVYLQTLDGGVANCGVGAGPATCVRIACQQQAAIWLCNDNDYPLTLRCWDMAYYSLGIINYCPFTIYNGDLYCGGQWFDERKFNIIVRWDNDNCGVGPPTTTARV